MTDPTLTLLIRVPMGGLFGSARRKSLRQHTTLTRKLALGHRMAMPQRRIVG